MVRSWQPPPSRKVQVHQEAQTKDECKLLGRQVAQTVRPLSCSLFSKITYVENDDGVKLQCKKCVGEMDKVLGGFGDEALRHNYEAYRKYCKNLDTTNWKESRYELICHQCGQLLEKVASEDEQ